MTMYATTTPKGRRVQLRNSRNEIVDSYRVPAGTAPEVLLASMGWAVRKFADGCFELTVPRNW